MAILTGKNSATLMDFRFTQYVADIWTNLFSHSLTVQPCPAWAMGSADCSRSFCTACIQLSAENISDLSHVYGEYTKIIPNPMVNHGQELVDLCLVEGSLMVNNGS